MKTWLKNIVRFVLPMFLESLIEGIILALVPL